MATIKKVGRPPKFETGPEMAAKVDEYFARCEKDEKPYTVTGLALALGLDRKGLILYQGKDEFRPVINRAKTKIEAQVETLLLTGKNQAGCIFWLKNFGWTDRQEIEVNEISGLTKDQLTDRLKTLLARKVA